MFDSWGVKVAYASKYGRQKVDRRKVGLFLAFLQMKDRLQQANTLHLIVKATPRPITVHTATVLIIILTLENTSYNAGVPDVKCVVIIVRNYIYIFFSFFAKHTIHPLHVLLIQIYCNS